MGPCFCDIKKDLCDPYCCCDPDCPGYIVEQWRANPDFICKDESKIRE
jgi:hypothetical protein